MGLKSQNKGNFKYYTVREGAFHHTEKGPDGSKKDVAGYSYTGKLTGIRIIDREYEGKQTQKVELKVEDADEIGLLQFGLESWYTISLFRRLANVSDWSGEFEFGTSQKEGGNKKVTFAWLKLNGKTVEQNKEAVPEPAKVIVSKKEQKDYTPVIDVVVPMVNRISDELVKLGHERYVPGQVTETKEVAAKSDEVNW